MLFDPIKIGSLELKNRICMPAIHHGYTPEGLVNERLIKYYQVRAGGGAALLIVGGCTVDTVGGGLMMIGLHDDRFIEGLKRLTYAVKSSGSKVAAQLYQAGRYAHSMFSGQQALAPSAIASRLTRETPKEMTIEDIETVIENFSAATLRAKQAGFDAVEIIASAGYLICQFLSPITNQRKDSYGGSWENRCRFGLELIRSVRSRVGPDYTLLLRLSGNDFMPGGNTNHEAAAFAAEMEKAGIDCFNVTGGWHETRVPQITGDLPRGGFAYLARGIKEAVKVPVIASNRISSPLQAEQILKDGLADLVNLGRPLIADPDLPYKAQQGRHSAIRYCIACNQGCMDSVFTLRDLFCTVNPMAGREHEIAITPTTKPRQILVVGGGPAGLETARVAALRGHQVTLWEKGPRLGGQLLYAARPTGKREFANLLNFYTHELAELGIEIVLGREGSVENIVSFCADAVVLATGAVPCDAPFPVADPGKVVPAIKILDGSCIPGSRVTVVGGGAVGCETAITIAEMGTIDSETLKFLVENAAEDIETLRRLLNRGTRQVSIVEQFKGVGRDIGISTRWVVMKNIHRLGIKVLDETKVKQVTAEGLILEKDGTETTLSADTVVLAVGARSENILAQQLKGRIAELHLIGDALEPRKINEAIREGFELALRL